MGGPGQYGSGYGWANLYHCVGRAQHSAGGAHPDECVKQDDPVDLFYTLLETMATLRDIHRINYSELPEEERAVLLERNGLQDYSNQTHTWIGVEGFRATQAFHDILAHFLKPPELRK